MSSPPAIAVFYLPTEREVTNTLMHWNLPNMTNKIPHLRMESGGMVLNVSVVNSNQFNYTSFQFITISFLLLSFEAYLALKKIETHREKNIEILLYFFQILLHLWIALSFHYIMAHTQDTFAIGMQEIKYLNNVVIVVMLSLFKPAIRCDYEYSIFFSLGILWKRKELTELCSGQKCKAVQSYK